MTTVSLRFDDEMKRQLDEMCDEMGMNLTTFFMIYAKKALRDRRIPFEVTAPLDPFLRQKVHAGWISGGCLFFSGSFYPATASKGIPPMHPRQM